MFHKKPSCYYYSTKKNFYPNKNTKNIIKITIKKKLQRILFSAGHSLHCLLLLCGFKVIKMKTAIHH